MIFFGRQPEASNRFDFVRAAASLGLFSGAGASHERIGDLFLAHMPSPRARPGRGWRAARSHGGQPILLDGWIDNLSELRGELGLGANAAPELVYAAAVDRWGDRADARVIGDYVAVLRQPDGLLRLSRAPYAQHSLHWMADGATFMACSIPRPLFAAGLPKVLLQDRIDDLLTHNLLPGDAALFDGLRVLDCATVVTVAPNGAIAGGRRWYDPNEIAPVRHANDEDYVAHAQSLLAEAVDRAEAMAGKKIYTLSGGLDSSLMVATALERGPATSVTFTPLSGWREDVTPGWFADDRPWVEAFAAANPGLAAHFTDNAGIGFDDRAEQLFLACDTGNPFRVLGTVMHGVLDKARELGGDWLLTATNGNSTISLDPPWGEAELFRRLRWDELYRMSAARRNDPRPVARRMVAHGLMPNLPPRLRRMVRTAVHRGTPPPMRANPLLRADGRLGHARDEGALERGAVNWGEVVSAREYARQMADLMGIGAEVNAGYAQVFGIRQRDVTNYRPLIEFCMAIPTRQHVWRGETRRLARRMGRGKLPEAQRTNRLYGEHNVDWHARLAPRLPALKAEIARIAQQPELAGVIDLDRAARLIDDWPKANTLDEEVAVQYRYYLPAALYLSRFVAFETGRNG